MKEKKETYDMTECWKALPKDKKRGFICSAAIIVPMIFLSICHNDLVTDSEVVFLFSSLIAWVLWYALVMACILMEGHRAIREREGHRSHWRSEDIDELEERIKKLEEKQ